MNKQQITNLIGAGTVTGLMVATALFLGGRPGVAQPEVASAAPAPIVQMAETSEVDQLRAALTTMQEREATYQDQIEKANVALAEQAEASAGYGDGEYEEYEDDDAYEHEEDFDMNEAYEDEDSNDELDEEDHDEDMNHGEYEDEDDNDDESEEDD